MKKIGYGLQYNVYDLGNDRVLKIETSTFNKTITLLRWGTFNPKSIKAQIYAADRILSNSIAGLKSSDNLDLSLIGNSVFRKDNNYEQDKVTSLKDYFSSHSLKENKATVDAWIESIFSLWKFKIADTVFNFTINNGVDNKGNNILIDLGELTFSKDEVERNIQEKKWLKQWSLKQIKDDSFKEYIVNRLAERLTLSNLETYWGSTD